MHKNVLLTIFSFSLKDPVVFTGTLRFNLDPFDEYSDEKLWKALDVTHLKTYVSSLEDGLQHELVEGGANLRFGLLTTKCFCQAMTDTSGRGGVCFVLMLSCSDYATPSSYNVFFSNVSVLVNVNSFV